MLTDCSLDTRNTGILCVGAGPAGLAPLVKAARDGTLSRLAARGLTVVDQASEIGAGNLGTYAIGSDTLADAFLECLDGGAEPRLAELAAHPAARLLAAFRGGPAPLPVVSGFLKALGRTLHAILLSHGAAVLTGWTASLSQRCGGGWRTSLTDRDGRRLEIGSEQLVLATGAGQSLEDIVAETVGGRTLLPALAGKLLLSGDALAHGGSARIAGRLQGRADPKVAILGGSHSALACANLLLGETSGIAFGPGALTLLHRRKLRLFYPSAAAALEDGYTDFDADDICPLTHRLFRLAGFRLDARNLVRRILGVGGASPDPRLLTRRLGPPSDPQTEDRQSWRILEDADLVIAAFGYRPRALRLLDSDGFPIRLAAQERLGARLVDQACRVLDHRHQPVPGVLAIGLGAGFVPGGLLGGEPSFVGQTNGLWLWQNDIGAMIVRNLLQSDSANVAA